MARRRPEQQRTWRTAAAALLALALASCAAVESRVPPLRGNDQDYERLMSITPRGDAFAKALTGEYALLARSMHEVHNWAAQQTAVNKGLLAAASAPPPPEAVADWPIDDAQAARYVESGRALLVAAIDAGAAARAPAATAAAQAKFDCWLIGQHYAWVPTRIAACRQDFQTAMGLVDHAMNDTGAMPLAAPSESALPELNVFFGFDRSDLTIEARQQLAKAAQAILSGARFKIKVIGHTDTSGTERHNLGLSWRRAEAVRRELEAYGIPANDIAVTGVGESDPMVPTANGVREAKNRRALIELAPP